MRGIKNLVVCSIVALISGTDVFAASSSEYALMGSKTWSAFECSVLAEYGNSKEQERLFNYGYTQGIVFMNALKENKIKSEDLYNKVPMGLLMHIQGPTADFALGRILEKAVDSALKNIIKSGDKINDKDVQKILAEGQYTKQNCQLIGR
ncbi:MAG: hypothetical protein NT103_03720 [Campylobacterales bacterium]|nr:hypothetical protein [Campylobacterales bacterium]